MFLTRQSWQAGRRYIIPFAATGTSLALVAWLLRINNAYGAAEVLWGMSIGILFLGILIALSFRDIARPYDQDPNLVYAPCSGTIKLTEADLVAVFMWLVTRHSVLNPAGGKLLSAEPYGNKRYPAMWLKASENHRYILTFSNGIVVRMISGIIARRVAVYDVVGKVLEAGARLGIICLASRVDVELPGRKDGRWIILVKKGQWVRQGEPIAVWVPAVVARAQETQPHRLHSSMRVL
jgi:hypothetical protein